jgi:hypothetical protein
VEETGLDTWEEVTHWLTQEALKHYPQSVFADKYRGQPDPGAEAARRAAGSAAGPKVAPDVLVGKIEAAIRSIAESEKHILELEQHIAKLEYRGASTERADKVLEKIEALLETKRDVLRTFQSMQGRCGTETVVRSLGAKPVTAEKGGQAARLHRACRRTLCRRAGHRNERPRLRASAAGRVAVRSGHDSVCPEIVSIDKRTTRPWYWSRCTASPLRSVTCSQGT